MVLSVSGDKSYIISELNVFVLNVGLIKVAQCIKHKSSLSK